MTALPSKKNNKKADTAFWLCTVDKNEWGVLFGKGNQQWLLTWKVGSYCCLPLNIFCGGGGVLRSDNIAQQIIPSSVYTYIASPRFIWMFWSNTLFIMLIVTNIQKLCFGKQKKTRKGVPKLQGPILCCMSVIDKKLAYIFCKDNCIDLPHGQEF